MPQLYYKENDTWAEYYGSMPIGSVYMSYESTSPATIYGGTWTRITSAVIRGNSGSTHGYAGSDTVTLTADNIPYHNHSINLYASYGTEVDPRYVYGFSGLERNIYTQDFRNIINNRVTTNYAGNQNSSQISVLPRRFEVYIWYRTA